MEKDELIRKYGCIDCRATDEAVARYKEVEDSFREALRLRYVELGMQPPWDPPTREAEEGAGE